MDDKRGSSSTRTCTRTRVEEGAHSPAPPRGRESKNKWDDVNAIEYDAGTQSLTKIPKDRIKDTTHTMIRIPRRGFSPVDRVDISIPVGLDVESPDFNLCLANVRMESLPFDVLWQRIQGNIKTIYVKGVPRAVLGSQNLSPAGTLISP